MGHAFGVPHPPGCQEALPTCDARSIMWTGFVSYPNTYPGATERSKMLASLSERANIFVGVTRWDDEHRWY